MMTITVDCRYHRDEFDDWLAGGSVEYSGRKFHWAAYDANYGFGWEIDPTADEDWDGVSEQEADKILTLIRKCLYQHKTEYVFSNSSSSTLATHNP